MCYPPLITINFKDSRIGLNILSLSNIRDRLSRVGFLILFKTTPNLFVRTSSPSFSLGTRKKAWQSLVIDIPRQSLGTRKKAWQSLVIDIPRQSLGTRRKAWQGLGTRKRNCGSKGDIRVRIFRACCQTRREAPRKDLPRPKRKATL